MKPYDSSNDALEFIAREAVKLAKQGMDRERALDAAEQKWLGSLDRVALKNQYEKAQLAAGKPTLSVTFGELMRVRK